MVTAAYIIDSGSHQLVCFPQLFKEKKIDNETAVFNDLMLKRLLSYLHAFIINTYAMICPASEKRSKGPTDPYTITTAYLSVTMFF